MLVIMSARCSTPHHARANETSTRRHESSSWTMIERLYRRRGAHRSDRPQLDMDRHDAGRWWAGKRIGDLLTHACQRGRT